MDDADPRDQIARLEDQIEQLTENITRYGKFILASRIAIGAGGLYLAAATLGVVMFDPLGFICAITAAIGGIVVLGSNTSSSRQAAAAIETAEALRAELIGTIDLQLVESKKLNGKNPGHAQP
jgi:hypothetical protein